MVTSGCATVNSKKYDKVVYSPTNPEDIKVFTFSPPRKYIEIGEINLQNPTYDIIQIIKESRDKVSKMGGEAVILKLQQEKGIVIRFK